VQARAQVEWFKDDCGCMLAHTDYHKAAEALGGVGQQVGAGKETLSGSAEARVASLRRALEAARAAGREGKPVLVNALIGKSSFRDGSISV